MSLSDLFTRFAALPDPEEGFPDRNFAEVFSDAKDEDLKLLALGKVPDDWDEEEVSNAAVHAYRLLATRGNPEDFRFFLTMLLVWEGLFVAECFGEELEWIMEQMGEPVIPEILAIIGDQSFGPLERAMVVEAAECFLKRAMAEEIIMAALVKELRKFKPVRLVNAVLINAIAQYGNGEYHDLIVAAFERNVVDVSFGGDLEAVEVEMGVRAERVTPAPNFLELEQHLAKEARRDALGEYPENGDLFEQADYLVQLHQTESSVRSASMLDGVYATVVSAPKMIRSGEIFQLIWDVQEAAPAGLPNFESEQEAHQVVSVMMNFYNEINIALMEGNYIPAIQFAGPEKDSEGIAHPEVWLLGVFLATEFLEKKFGTSRYTRQLSDLALDAMKRCHGGEVFEIDSAIDLVMPVIELFLKGREGAQPTMPLQGPSGGSGWGVSPVVETKGKIGRNDPCPCGSGKKYKRCCAN